tara:strand:- start:172 stop:957 length:786 start_codon:yes stop_codon:yes gene_type:complete
MSRFFLSIEFDGASFSGWQIQPDVPTVEGTIEQALHLLFQQPMDLVGQGRTDASVNAKEQIAHIDINPEDWNRFLKATSSNPEEDHSLLCHRLNRILGPSIYISNIWKVKEDAHARFDALYRSYMYRIVTRPSPLRANQSWYAGEDWNLNVLNELAVQLVGVHDFDSLSKTNPDNYTTLCTIVESNWTVEGDELFFRITANRFLRNMVRRLVGTMWHLQNLDMNSSSILSWIHDLKDHQIYTAPAYGLCLTKVQYPEGIFI